MKTNAITKAHLLRIAHRKINEHFPNVGESIRWTEDGKHGVVIEDGRVTMLGAAGRRRKRKPTITEFSSLLWAYRGPEGVAAILDS